MTHVTQSTRATKEKEIERKWHVVDMAEKVLGREIPRIAELLQGKHKVHYAPYLDMGDYVIVLNMKSVKVTGKKEDEKEYKYFSGYPGGLRSFTFKEMMQRNPKEIVRHAVSGMLPKNKLRDRRMARLHIYEGSEHPYLDKISNKN